MKYNIHFETLGCKLNQIETESAARAFAEAGFNTDLETATAKGLTTANTFLCIVNTCTVTGKAEQKARRLIRLLQKLYPASVILVTGCYAQVEPETIRTLGQYVTVLPGTQKDYLVKLPQICSDFLLSKGNKDQNTYSLQELFETVDNAIKKANSTSTEYSTSNVNTISTENQALNASKLTSSITTARFTLSTDTFARHSRASLKIQDGCNNRCAYCRICLARGPSVSLAATEVLERVKQLEKQNQREVVLTGVNVSQYSSDLNGKKIDIVGLLDYLLTNTKQISFRFSSLYPDRITDDFCELLKNDRVRPHFHLSVQSGSTNILHSMGRRYGDEVIIYAVDKLRSLKANPFIACDVIAGFPGETVEDFNRTMEVCKRCNFTYIHAFPFSPRPGTKAFTMKPVVPQSVASERIHMLTNLAVTNKIDYVSSYLGKTVKAIIQTGKGDTAQAVTENFLHVRIKLPTGIDTHDIERTEVSVKIIKVLEDFIRRDEELEAEAVLD